MLPSTLTFLQPFCPEIPKTKKQTEELQLTVQEGMPSKLDIGVLITRRGFWGPFYYNYNKELPSIVLVIS